MCRLQCAVVARGREATVLVGTRFDYRMRRVLAQLCAMCISTHTSAPKVKHIPEMEAHCRFGHIPVRAIREMITKGFITGVELIPSGEDRQCEACICAKSTCKPVPSRQEGHCMTDLGEEIHSDVWGPSCVVMLGGRKYYISFTDDHSHFSTLYLLRKKSEAFESFRAFEAWLEKHHNVKIRFLNLDRGGEYLSDNFTTHLEQQGIEYKLSVHDTSEQAGVSERLNRNVMEKVHAMLINSGLPRFLWGEALMHAVWLKNRMSSKALDGCTPLKATTGVKPDFSGVPEWGACTWVHSTADEKVGEHAKAGRWVGFDAQSKGHHVYWPETCTVTVERNVASLHPTCPLCSLTTLSSLRGRRMSMMTSPPSRLSLTLMNMPILHCPPIWSHLLLYPPFLPRLAIPFACTTRLLRFMTSSKAKALGRRCHEVSKRQPLMRSARTSMLSWNYSLRTLMVSRWPRT